MNRFVFADVWNKKWKCPVLIFVFMFLLLLTDESPTLISLCVFFYSYNDNKPNRTFKNNPLPSGEYFFCFDPRKDYWSHLAPMGVPRSQGLAALHKHRVYYIAGVCRNHQRTFTVEVYDLERTAWRRARDLPLDQATSPYIKAMLLQGRLHLFVRATQVMVEEHVFRTSRKNSLYRYDDEADAWTKVYETPDRLWDLGRHFECVVAKLYPQCLQKVL